MVQFGAPGSPDIIAITSGLFVGIECKRPGGKQSEKQIAFQQNIERAGGYYILANSDNELEDGVKKIQYEQKRKRNSI